MNFIQKINPSNGLSRSWSKSVCRSKGLFWGKKYFVRRLARVYQRYRIREGAFRRILSFLSPKYPSLHKDARVMINTCWAFAWTTSDSFSRSWRMGYEKTL